MLKKYLIKEEIQELVSRILINDRYGLAAVMVLVISKIMRIAFICCCIWAIVSFFRDLAKDTGFDWRSIIFTVLSIVLYYLLKFMCDVLFNIAKRRVMAAFEEYKTTIGTQITIESKWQRRIREMRDRMAREKEGGES